MIIKAKFLRNGTPCGRSYSYIAPEDGETYKVGDYVYLNKESIGQIVEVDVPEENVGFPVDKLQTFIGRAEAPELPVISKIQINIPESQMMKGEN